MKLFLSVLLVLLYSCSWFGPSKEDVINNGIEYLKKQNPTNLSLIERVQFLEVVGVTDLNLKRNYNELNLEELGALGVFELNKCEKNCNEDLVLRIQSIANEIIRLQKPTGAFYSSRERLETPVKVDIVGVVTNVLLRTYDLTKDSRFLIPAMNSITALGERLKRLPENQVPGSVYFLSALHTGLNQKDIEGHHQRFEAYLNIVFKKLFKSFDIDSKIEVLAYRLIGYRLVSKFNEDKLLKKMIKKSERKLIRAQINKGDLKGSWDESGDISINIICLKALLDI